MNPFFNQRTLAGLALATVLGFLRSSAQGTTLFQLGETGLAYDIPDNDGSGIARTLTGSGLPTTTPFSLLISLTVEGTGVGAYNGDYYAYLLHSTPGGAVTATTILLNRVGRDSTQLSGYGDNGFSLTLRDSAPTDVHLYQLLTGSTPSTQITGTYQPDGRDVDPLTVLDTSPRSSFLSSIETMDPNGQWTLFVADMESGGTGRLTSWQITALDASAVPETRTILAATLTLSSALALAAWNRRRSQAGRAEAPSTSDLSHETDSRT
jgi:hypothetical protein